MNIHPGKFGLSIFLICMACMLQAQRSATSLLSLKGNAKIDSLNEWYFRQVRQLDSVRALSTLAQLETTSKRQKDKTGIAAATYFKGQYLAVKLNDPSGVILMEEGIRLADEAGSDLQAAYYKHHLGVYCFSTDDRYNATLHKMLEAHYTFKKIGYEKIADQAYYLNRLAFVYYHLGNYNGALEYLQTALRHRVHPEGFKVTLLNTIGQCYRNLYKYDSSFYYFNKANLVAIKYNDLAWIGISAGSIGSLYILQKDFNKAKPYCETYYSYSIAAKDTNCIAESLTYLGDINLEQGNLVMALQQLTEASDYLKKVGARSKENYLRQLYLFQVFAKAYQLQHKNDLAWQYQQLANSARDSLEKRSLLSGSVGVKQQLEAEQYLASLALVEKDKQNTLLKQYFFIAGLVLSVVILWLAYNRQKLKRKKDAELQKNKAALIEAEKRSVETELRHAESLLDNYTDNLRQKTELLEQVQTEINALRHLHGDDQTPQVLYLNTLARSTILTEQDWDNFSRLFDKVHTGFFIRLKEKYPNITPAEIRLLCLTKLNLSTKEMAGMLGVSTDAIKKTRQRLRKKMEVDEEKNLEELVAVL